MYQYSRVKSNIGNLITDLLTSDSIVYQLATRKLNVEPTDCVYVDDNLNCVEGSKLAGMKGLHFKQIDDLIENLRKYGIRF